MAGTRMGTHSSPVGVEQSEMGPGGASGLGLAEAALEVIRGPCWFSLCSCHSLSEQMPWPSNSFHAIGATWPLCGAWDAARQPSSSCYPAPPRPASTQPTSAGWEQRLCQEPGGPDSLDHTC